LPTVGSASAWSLKALRAGQGAQFHMQIDEAMDEAAIAGRLRVPLIATSLEQSTPLPALDLRKPVAWAFGHEGPGVSPRLLATAQHRARIPMRVWRNLSTRRQPAQYVCMRQCGSGLEVLRIKTATIALTVLSFRAKREISCTAGFARACNMIAHRVRNDRITRFITGLMKGPETPHRNIHAAFGAKMAGEAHRYCGLAFQYTP
jgi:SpoU rRNA Methylase family